MVSSLLHSCSTHLLFVASLELHDMFSAYNCVLRDYTSFQIAEGKQDKKSREDRCVAISVNIHTFNAILLLLTMLVCLLLLCTALIVYYYIAAYQ
jgi:hypothetical protein